MSSPLGRIETLVSTEVPEKSGTFEHLHKVTGVNKNHADQNYHATKLHLVLSSQIQVQVQFYHIHILMPTLTTVLDLL